MGNKKPRKAPPVTLVPYAFEQAHRASMRAELKKRRKAVARGHINAKPNQETKAED